MLGGRPSCVIVISASLFALRSAASVFRRSFRALSSLAQPEHQCHRVDRVIATARPAQASQLGQGH